MKITYSDGTPTVTYAYDKDGNKTAITDATGTRTLAHDKDGRVTSEGGFTYSYNADGEVTARTYPDGKSLSYSYTPDGQVSSLITSSSTTWYTYDQADNLVFTAAPDEVTETRGYDAASRLTSITDATASATLDSYDLTLDADGQPTQVTVTQDGAAGPTQYYGYDIAGRLTSACGTSSGPSACSSGSAGTASGSSSGGVTAVAAGPGAVAVSWPAPSSGTGITGYTVTASPGGKTASAGPYATSATVAGLTAGTSYTFTVTTHTASGTTTSGSTTAVTPGNETTYGYDAAGNLASSESDGVTTTNTFNADEELTQSVTGPATTSYTYDADGNQISAANGTFTYNGAGELSSADTAAGTFSYTYDATGDLASTSLSGSKIQGTVWDLNSPQPMAVEDTNAAGTTTADYAWNPSGTLASVTTAGGTNYAVSDWLGSVTGLVSASGTQVSATMYSPYGTPSTTDLASGAPAASIGYAASYSLPGGTSLDDMRARDYNPGTGEFTSVDPALATTGQPYSYVGDAPTYLSDPSGKVDTGLLMGVCGTAAADAAVVLGFGLGGSVCGVSDLTSNQYGFTATGEVSFQGAGAFAGLSIYGVVSNANTVADMGGPFYAANISLAVAGGVSGEFFWGVFPGFTGVVGFAGGPAIPPFSWGMGVSFWLQDTATYTLPGWVTEYLDWLNPIPKLLNLLGWSTAKDRAVLQAAYATAYQSHASLLPCYSQDGNTPVLE